MSEPRTNSEEQVGAGRSAVVYLDHDEQGRPLARKVFTGDAASKLVLYVLTGSANPYTWCEAAMACAVIRRRMLSSLTRVWFGECLRLPRHDDWGWNEHHRAYELSSELINGYHTPLRLPGEAGEVDYLKELVDQVMKPLQRRLIEAGFDGLAWQAGKGNPVATNNFMLERNSSNGLRWVWIDLESGVPALFALNPLATLAFYLPKSWHHRRWLFDDVDTNKLQTYIRQHHEQITGVIGAEGSASLLRDAEELEKQQGVWRSLRRFQRSIAYEHARGRLSDEQAEWYRTRPLRWYAYFIPVATKKFLASMGKGITGLIRRVRAFPYRNVAERVRRYISSSRYRWGVARWIVARSVRSWARRGFLDRAGVHHLLRELRQDEASVYLADFSVHIVIKPLVKIIQWGVLPPLLLSGVISEFTFFLLLVTGGSIARTLYTFGRTVQAVSMRQRLPWVALVVGLVPVAGNAAYPVQLLYSSTERAGNLARFIVYDIAAGIGRAIPIWGGADTQVEHFANRSCDVMVRLLARHIIVPVVKLRRG